MILVTGGLGYIGSHLAATLMSMGHEVMIVDNLSNSKMEVLERLEQMSKRYVTFLRLDIRNTPALQKVFEQYPISVVVHCAGMKVLSDSVMQPLDYYNSNIGGTLSLLRVMQRTGVRNLVYTSSAAVYGAAHQATESHAPNPQTPYAHNMLTCEQMLKDVVVAEGDWRVVVLRVSNVAGAYPQYMLGEFPSGIATNLFPYLAQVAKQERSTLEVFGDQHDTADGTGSRDFIHVMDVVDGYLQSLHWLFDQQQATFEVFNLGTGQETSVAQVLALFKAASGQMIPTEVVPPRLQEVAYLSVNPQKAQQVLKFAATRSVGQMVADFWQSQQPLS